MRPTPFFSLGQVIGLLIINASTGCASDNADSAAGSDAGAGGLVVGGDKGKPWPGDPCTLLSNADFAMLTPLMTISSAEPHNLKHPTFSPDCRFYLNGDGNSAAVGLFVDLAGDYDLQKSIFKGKAVSGIGKSAWSAEAGAPGNATVDVLLDAWSFRVDSTYEFELDDLTILAKAIATRLK